MNLKEFSKKLGIYSIVFLLYLSNTGLIYSVHTCIHSGLSVIELPSFSLEEDHCADVIANSTCQEVQDDCCKKEATTEKRIVTRIIQSMKRLISYQLNLILLLNIFLTLVTTSILYLFSTPLSSLLILVTLFSSTIPSK